jgi:hypothetical protein
MQLVLHSTTLSENNPISIHKIIEEEVTLKPGQKKEIKVYVFPRRIGVHGLKGIKITDKLLRGDKDHDSKGYLFTAPKFSINDELGAV